MRRTSILFALFLVSACSGSSTSPSSVGSLTDVAGAWTGTFASSNNLTYPIGVDITQTGSKISGTWQGTSVAWSGQVTGSLDSSSFSGQLTFTGRAADDTVCTGTAALTGSVSAKSMSWSSSTGVQGGNCPAPLPVGVQIELQR
jgi:hypothetical protein